MSKNNRSRAKDREIDMSKSVRFFTPYSKLVASLTVLSISLALFLQVATGLNPAIIVYPIVASYWLAAYLPGGQYYWVAIFAVLSLVIYSLLFFPVLMRSKFRTRIGFALIQGILLISYLFMNITSYTIFSGWMSV